MRILITSIVDLKRVTHNRIHVFADYLSRRHDVTVLCLNAWWLEKSETDDFSADYHSDSYFRELFERTRILYLSQGRRPAVLQELSSLRTLDGLLREIDLASFDVHLNYCNLLAGYLVARKAKRLGIPTVFDIADDLPRRFANSPQVPRLLRGPARLAANAMLRANLGLASRVTYVTQVLKDAYSSGRDHALVIPNGVHPGLPASGSPQALRKALGIDEGFVLGFVGVLLPRVDVNLMFSAMERICQKLANVRMLIVGGGDRLQEARDLARSWGISDRVLFTGFVPFGEVPRYVSCMDVCLMSIADSADCQHAFPLKLVEYMACEKPVVSTPLAGVREAVGDRVLYAQGSDEFADRMAELYYDEDLRHRMGTRGRRFVQENYSWTQICHSFEAVLADAVSQSTLNVLA